MEKFLNIMNRIVRFSTLDMKIGLVGFLSLGMRGEWKLALAPVQHLSSSLFFKFWGEAATSPLACRFSSLRYYSNGSSLNPPGSVKMIILN